MHPGVITAPTRRTPIPPVSPSPNGDQSGSVDTRLLVLIVDDTEDTRLLYAEAFEEAGYRVEEAANGLDALDLIAESKPALVLMDLSMPGMDGWEATRRIKAHPPTADVTVIAVSGHGTHLGRALAIDAGAEVVLVKPCLPADILACAREMLGGVSQKH